MTIPSIHALEDLLRSGRHAEAEQSARTWLEKEPDSRAALVILAVAVGSQGRLADALPLYRRLAEIEPTEPAHWSNLGTALRDAGQLDESAASYVRALELRPQDPALLTNLGLLSWEQGNVVDTRRYMTAATARAPDWAEPRIYGALASHACGADDEARALLAERHRWPQLPDDLEIDLALAEAQLERAEEAIVRLRRVTERSPHLTRARIRLASLYERLNRVSDAAALVDQVATGDDAELEALRATLLQRADQVAEARSIYQGLVSKDPGSRNAAFHFALGKTCDRSGDVDAAMRAFSKGHALQVRMVEQLDPSLAASDRGVFLGIDPVEMARSCSGWDDIGGPARGESPIFIVGFPRSGTTLLEQMLDSHPGLVSMDERAFVQDVIDGMNAKGLQFPNDLGRLDERACAALRDIYWRKVREVVSLDPGQRLVDKNPLNILRLPMLLRIFPNASVILSVRHPLDVVLSNYMQSFRSPAYQMLCSSFERLGQGFSLAMRCWDAVMGAVGAHGMVLRYEDLVDSTPTTVRELTTFLSIDVPERLLAFADHAREKGFIGTPSYAQVIEPINRSGIGRWQRYRRWLEPAIPHVQVWCERFGYDDVR